MAEESTNALGLDFSQLTVDDNPEVKVDDVPPESSSQNVDPATASPNRPKEKEKPYVNPERVKTGGSQRDKLTDEALQERMARIREQNEKIRQRKLDVQADEDAFRKTQEVERAKQAQNRKIQSDIDRARDQNAKRKLDKVQSREWDSGKPSADRHRPNASRSQPAAPVQAEAAAEPQEEVSAPEAASSTTNATPASPAEGNAESGGNWARGGHLPPHPRGRGRGRGAGNRGRGGNNRGRQSGTPAASTSEAPTTEPKPPAST
ncbi:hypothetical protein GALMADRAFT_239290 [Galerina marginata CBS 339.88]|uniref:Uncharacterized protein n=1 Tax=Galerina marginata (strain CBS 339.88) TaxID=685588 RepID=A0A067TE38_GALM3|nr:hypothetical protein GALMADRAFT_239290 [Galerina marginata CBS 339.88]